ncbi:hypothetical protein JZ751_012737 [Albula glossodonta]|uniref:non-specific serine/threonine protein kinase n=1 Tax=Albula glossodonta TaxID=121402 RepID=A0A8T2NA40_9TELE|nr:hypothetical protein JZ751_012737 [Albula glossodonta]
MDGCVRGKMRLGKRTSTISQALEHCHSLNIAHRDLKPENLLFKDNSLDAPVKLCDFGFAKIDQGDLMTPQFTPYYVAPQVLEAQRRHQKEKSGIIPTSPTPYTYNKVNTPVLPSSPTPYTYNKVNTPVLPSSPTPYTYNKVNTPVLPSSPTPYTYNKVNTPVLPSSPTPYTYNKVNTPVLPTSYSTPTVKGLKQSVGGPHRGPSGPPSPCVSLQSCDLWSLGVIIYVMLCGYPPFYSKHHSRTIPKDMRKKIMTGSFDFPEDEWSQISEMAKDIVRKLLKVKPEERLTIDGVLAHPWLNCTEALDNVLPSAQMMMDKVQQRPVALGDPSLQETQTAVYHPCQSRCERGVVVGEVAMGDVAVGDVAVGDVAMGYSFSPPPVHLMLSLGSESMLWCGSVPGAGLQKQRSLSVFQQPALLPAVVAGIQQAHAEQLANMRIQELNVSLKPLNSVNNPILRKRKLLGSVCRPTKPGDSFFINDPENGGDDTNVALEKLRDVIAQCILPQAGENEDEKLNEVMHEAWRFNRDCKLLRDGLHGLSWDGRAFSDRVDRLKLAEIVKQAIEEKTNLQDSQ